MALALAGCSKDDPSKTNGQPSKPKEDPAVAAAKRKAAAEARTEKIATLTAQRDKLKGELAAAEKAIKDLAIKHEAEEAGAPNLRKMQRYFLQLQKDSRREASRLKTMEKQYDAVKQAAALAATSEIKRLQGELAAYEAQYDDAMSSWRKVADEAATGAVEESPVKKDLDAIRVIRTRWFDATPKSRVGKASGGEKSSISSKFRTWIKEDKIRTRVIDDVLKGKHAPKGKTVDSYDFTDLDFFILLEVHEADLDRKNIVEELKGLGESMKRADSIMVKADAVRAAIDAKMTEGGGDLEIYADLHARLPGQRTKVDSLAASVSAMLAVFSEADSASESRSKAMDEAIQARDAAKNAVREATKKLRAMGAR